MLRTIILPHRLTTTAASTILRQPARLSSSSSADPDTSLSQPKVKSSDEEENRKANSSSSPTSSSDDLSDKKPKRTKTIAEADAELAQKMSGLAGDGGEAGVELEDGQPVSMKRSVRNNMFRYI